MKISYLFECHLNDGTLIQQTEEDVSKIDPARSACRKLKDSRLHDPSYLAGRYMVFLGEMFAVDYLNPTAPGVYPAKKDRLDFIHAGIVMSDPWDIEYRYVVDCGKIGKRGLPKVTCYKVSVNEDGTDDSCEEVAIPGRTRVTSKTETEPAEEWINEFMVDSFTKSGVKYTVKQNRETLAWTCSCPSFKFGHQGSCKHTNTLPFNLRHIGGLARFGQEVCGRYSNMRQDMVF